MAVEIEITDADGTIATTADPRRDRRRQIRRRSPAQRSHGVPRPCQVRTDHDRHHRRHRSGQHLRHLRRRPPHRGHRSARARRSAAARLQHHSSWSAPAKPLAAASATPTAPPQLAHAPAPPTPATQPRAPARRPRASPRSRGTGSRCCYQPGTAGERFARGTLNAARKARHRLAGFGTEAAGTIVRIHLMDPFPDPTEPGPARDPGLRSWTPRADGSGSRCRRRRRPRNRSGRWRPCSQPA